MIAWTCGRFTALALTLAVATPLGAEASRGSRHAGYYTSGRAAARVMYEGVSQYSHYRSAYRGGYSSGGLQCVPFARENTGIELAGNAANWWDNAAGVYERGSRPEVGSIMNFRATGRMRMGHVAVVSNVIDARNVQIDHANWSGRGVVTRNVTVVDVSPGNDWSEVRVALGTGDFGSVYPTYGFIYDRPDKGTMIANTSVVRGASVAASAPLITASLPQVNPVTIDLRPAAARTAVLLAPRDEEVAEAADDLRSPRAPLGRPRVASGDVWARQLYAGGTVWTGGAGLPSPGRDDGRALRTRWGPADGRADDGRAGPVHWAWADPWHAGCGYGTWRTGLCGAGPHRERPRAA